MIDLHRTDVLFRLALEERRAMMYRPFWTFEVAEREPRWRTAIFSMGRGLVRFGIWLQAVACRSCPPAVERAYADGGH